MKVRHDHRIWLNKGTWAGLFLHPGIVSPVLVKYVLSLADEHKVLRFIWKELEVQLSQLWQGRETKRIKGAMDSLLCWLL